MAQPYGMSRWALMCPRAPEREKSLWKGKRMGVQAVLLYTWPLRGLLLAWGIPCQAAPWSAKRLGQEYRVGVGAF